MDWGIQEDFWRCYPCLVATRVWVGVAACVNAVLLITSRGLFWESQCNSGNSACNFIFCMQFHILHASDGDNPIPTCAANASARR